MHGKTQNETPAPRWQTHLCFTHGQRLGMRVESVDEVEIIRRMTEGIYDEAEFQKALAWAKETTLQ